MDLDRNQAKDSTAAAHYIEGSEIGSMKVSAGVSEAPSVTGSSSAGGSTYVRAFSSRDGN